MPLVPDPLPFCPPHRPSRHFEGSLFFVAHSRSHPGPGRRIGSSGSASGPSATPGWSPPGPPGPRGASGRKGYISSRERTRTHTRVRSHGPRTYKDPRHLHLLRALTHARARAHTHTHRSFSAADGDVLALTLSPTARPVALPNPAAAAAAAAAASAPRRWEPPSRAFGGARAGPRLRGN